jgi:DNA-binding NarL/FixJ family response regulator
VAAPKKNPKAKKQILIVDDHPMMRQGLAQLINGEPELVVSWEASNAAQGLEMVSAHSPDLVLADISLPDKNGLELIKDIHAEHPTTAILVVSMHDEGLYADRVLRAGGRGYIMKQEGGKQLLVAIRQVLNGQIYVSGKMSEKILEIFSKHRSDSHDSPATHLSDREFEVFQLIGGGKGTREIAEKLHLSVKTVEVHRANIKKKLKLKSATELIRQAVQWTDAQGAA